VGSGTRPTVGGLGARGGRGFGARTAGRRRAKAKPQPTWDLWWNLNKWEYLHINEILKRHAAASQNADTNLGGTEGGAVAGGALPREFVGREVIPSLKRAVTDRYATNRFAAIVALGKTGDPQAIAPLVSALKDGNVEVRQAAALALGLLGQQVVVPYLVEIMTDSPRGRRLVGRDKVDAGMRRSAAFALGLARDPKAIDPLTKMASSDDTVLATFAMSGLGALGETSSIPFLCRTLADTRGNAVARAAAAIALGKIGDRGPIILRVLKGGLQDRRAPVVRASATALASLARPEDATIIGALIKTVEHHSDAESRALALMTLAQVGGPRAFDVAESCLNKRGLLAGYAPLAVALASKKAEKGLVRARSVLRRHARRSRDSEVRRASWLALGLLGSRGDAELLMEVASTAKVPDERAAAVHALGLIGDPACVPLLRDLLAPEVHGAVRGEAALALALVGRRHEASERLVGVMADARDDFLRASCALALGLLGDRSSISGLRELSVGVSVDGNTRAFASGALGLLAEPDDLPVLYRYRANNLFWFDVPELRRMLMLL